MKRRLHPRYDPGANMPMKRKLRPRFDPGANLSRRLQRRMDGFYKSPCHSQFGYYGPFNAYFSTKFPPDQFLVKPQKLLRRALDHEDSDNYRTPPTESEGGSDSGSDRLSVASDDFDLEFSSADQSSELSEKRRTRGSVPDGSDEDTTDEEVGNTSADSIDSLEVGNYSFDSTGIAVGRKRFHPDFTIESYWGADNDGTPPDVIRVVIEVGVATPEDNAKTMPHETRRNKVGRQFEGYLTEVGPNRFRGCVWGIATLGTWAIIRRCTAEETEDVTKWISIYNPQFAAEIDKIVTFCKADDSWDDEDDEEDVEDDEEDVEDDDEDAWNDQSEE